MISETFASAILTASVTGSGLLIAIFALIQPVWSRIMDNRKKLLEEKVKEFEAIKGKMEMEDDNSVRQLNRINREIKKIKTMPKYLWLLFPIAFAFFVLDTGVTVMWFLGIRGWIIEGSVVGFLIISMSCFLVVGASAVNDVFSSMYDEFEEVTTSKKKAESATTLEQGTRGQSP